MRFSKPFQIQTSECDEHLEMAPSAMLAKIQEALLKRAEQRKIGRMDCQEKNLTWIIRSHDISINRLPVADENIILASWISSLSLTGLYGRIKIFSADRKKELLSSVSQTVLYDINKSRPVSVKKSFPFLTPDIPQENQITKIPDITRIDMQKEECVERDHIDFNHHMNNAQYLPFATRGLSDAFIHKNTPQKIQIIYNKPAVKGEKIMVQTQMGKNDTTHNIVSKNDPLKNFAKVHIMWKKRIYS